MSNSSLITTNQFEYLFKFISVGDSGVGKSCLLLRLTQNDFVPTETTIGIEFGSALININQKRVKLQIWDTAGQESFRSISRAYYRNAIGCILVYDMTRRETFNHLQSWLDDVSMHGNDLIKTCVVANKLDMESKRVVSREEGEEFAKSNGLIYCEVSAKSGKNVEQVFTSLAQQVFTSLNLIRDISQFSDAEIKKLESHGVKVGPRKPLVLISPPGSGADNSFACC